MARHSAEYEYVAEEIKASPVIQTAFRCGFQSSETSDLVIVKRDSIALLCTDLNDDWVRKAHRDLRLQIRHAACLHRDAHQDTIAVTTDSGRIDFIGYRDGSLEVLHEMQTSNLYDTPLSVLDRLIQFDAKGRFMCLLAMENRLAIYKLGDAGSGVSFSARRVFTIEGVLLNCCFLRQNRGSNSLVIHIIHRRSCRLALLNWLEDDLLEAIIPRFMPLDQSMAMCLFMLPLSRKTSAAFLHISAEQIALIHEDNVHCGDLQFSTMQLNGLTPSAIIELHCSESTYIALMSTSDKHIHIVVLDALGNLSCLDLGSVGFIATSLVFLKETDSDPCTISTFLCGNNGESGFYNLTVGSSSTVMSRSLEAVPAKDFLVLTNHQHNIRNKISTVGGISEASSIQSHSSGLAAYAQDEFAILETPNTAPKQIFTMIDQFSQSFVLLSLPWSSQLLQLHSEPESEVHDVGSRYGLADGVPTVLIFPLGDCFMQVTPTSVVQCRGGEVPASSIANNVQDEVTVLAQSCNGILARILRTEATYVLQLATFIKTEDGRFELVTQGAGKVFTVEVISMQFIALNMDDGASLLLLCFADGRILLLRIEEEHEIVLVDDTNSLVESARHTGHEDDASIPHSSIILQEQGNIHLLISLRSGAIAHFRSREAQFVLEALHQRSQTPITFTGASYHSHVCYFLGEHLGRVAVIDGELIIDTIGRSGKNPETFACSLDPFFSPSHSASTRQHGLLCLADGILSFNIITDDLEDITEVNILGESAQRMLQVDELDCVLVATNKVTINPEGERGVLNMANLQVRRRRACLTTSPLRDSKKQSLIFKPGERIYALIQWDVTINGKDRSWTVVGSSKRNTKTGNRDEGKLTVLRLKAGGDKIDVRKEFSPSFPKPVYALCAFGLLSLVVAHGNVLEVCTLDLENRGLASQAQAELRSPAVALYTYDEYVFAATQKDSILIFRYQASEKKLDRIATDSYPRLSVSMTVSRDQLVILTDKSKQVSIHNWDAETAKLTLLQIISMPSVIVRTRLLELEIPEKDVTSLVPDNFIIVALGLDGSLYSIFRIHKIVSRQFVKLRKEGSQSFWKDHKMSDLMDRFSQKDFGDFFDNFNGLTTTDEHMKTLRKAIISRTKRALAL